MSLWLVGAGPHAREYAKVLKHMHCSFEVVGRGEESSRAFESSIGVHVKQGGLEAILALNDPPQQAIVAVSYDQLARVATTLIRAGTKQILLEKPGALNLMEGNSLNVLAKQYDVQVWVAYNRRYYSSTILAREMIRADGGATSCTFEFTEWAHTIEPMMLPVVTKNAWMMANSSHVPDLAFYLCGLPTEWGAWRGGAMSWHPASARFCGSGITDQGVLFSYHADWEAPGRWGLDVLTLKRRYTFRPLEDLQVTQIASTEAERVPLSKSLDLDFKPGLYRQTEAFLAGDSESLCSLHDQVSMIAVYSRMAGYT